MMKRVLAAAVAAMLTGVIAVSPAGAAKKLTTLTMDEVPFQSVDGLTVGGVKFGFTVGGSPDTGAYYHAGGPGTISFVQDPSLEGTTAGTLTVTFPKPTTVARFGIALNSFSTLSPGAVVKVVAPSGKVIDTVALQTESTRSFTEAQFNWDGRAVSKLIIDPSDDTSRFAFDNLTFHAGGGE